VGPAAIHIVKDAKYLDGFRLLLTFGDGAKKVVDLGDHLAGPVFRPLLDVEQFKRFRVCTDTDRVVWDNGADMSPDFLYEIGTAEAASTTG